MPTAPRYTKEEIQKFMKRYRSCNQAAKSLGITPSGLSVITRRYGLTWVKKEDA